MKTRPFIFFVAAIAACMWEQGCTVGPDYHAPVTRMPVSFAVAPATQPSDLPPVAVDVTRWWTSLGDRELNSLVDRAIGANPDLEMALMRLQQARAMEAAVGGTELPAMEASGGAGRGTGTNSTKGRISQPLNAGTNTTGLSEITEAGGLDAAFNLDLFGGLRREIEAARHDVQAAAEARNAVLVAVIADVVRAYADERAMELRLTIAEGDIKAEQQSFDLVQARYDRGFTNELDPALAQRQLASVRAEIAPLQASIQQDQRRVAVLLGKEPEALHSELSTAANLPALPRRIQPGLPVELLRRRPDIREAERELAASTARIGVATDALYPHVILTGGLGLQGEGLGRTPVKYAFIGSVGPAAYWPLLDFGTLDAQVERQDYRTRELLVNYRQTVLSAVEQVDNAIDNYTAEQDRLQSLADALAAAERAVKIASQRYDRGFTNFLDVLDAQRELYGLQDQNAAAQQEVVGQYAALYEALGGGWESFQNVPSIRQPRPAIIAAFHHDTEYKDGDGK